MGEQGYSDACMPLCTEEKVVSRIAQTCRAAAIEMPRPTVRKWSEHGYNVAFERTKKAISTYFYNEKQHLQRVSDEENMTPEQRQQQQQEEQRRQKQQQQQQQTTSASAASQSVTQAKTQTEEAATPLGNVIASIPITLDDTTLDLEVHEGETAEDATIAFCKIHLKEDMSGCIRQLLPNVLDAMSA